MCGFVAIFAAGRRLEPGLLADVERDIWARGPDSGGVINELGAALVFRRLAIIDPHAVSDQPMSDRTGRYTIVFNGEIYNYRQLRTELQSEGVHLRTSGDTEVIVEGYAHWGERIVEKLEGMFAFVLIDRQEQKAFAARDPFGIKPLYMHRRNGMVAFASAARPLTRLCGAAADPVAVAELLTFRFAAGRLSNYAGIDKVPGGVSVTVSLADSRVSERRYVDPLSLLDPDDRISFGDAKVMAADALKASVRDHLQSDVGYALQLSGGVDSSLVAALAAREAGRSLASFGITLPGESHDEARWQRLVADRYNLDHTEIPLTGKDFSAALPDAVSAMEGPTPHFGCVMLMLACKVIGKSSKVVLTGEGADEMFGGYRRYYLWRDLRRKQRIANIVPAFGWKWLRRWREIERYRNRDSAIYASVFHDLATTESFFPSLAAVPGFREEVASRFDDYRTRMFAVDQAAYLESLLTRQDKMAMSASVEARVPFTHWPLAKIVNRFPADVRAPGGDTKPLLKAIAEDYLPHDLVRRRKNGLVLPLRDWLRDSKLLGQYLDLLTEPNCALAEYGEGARLKDAVDAFRRGDDEPRLPFEQLINLELWLRDIKRYPGRAAGM